MSVRPTKDQLESHFADMREDFNGHYAYCPACGYEGKRRSVRTDAVLDANAHRKRHHCVQWYVQPEVRHQRSSPRPVPTDGEENTG